MVCIFQDERKNIFLQILVLQVSFLTCTGASWDKSWVTGQKWRDINVDHSEDENQVDANLVEEIWSNCRPVENWDIWSKLGNLVKGGEENNFNANQGSLHQEAMGSLVWKEGQGCKERENSREEKSLLGTRNLLIFVEVGKRDDRVEEDYCHGPECVVAQKPPAEGKSSCPEGDVGEKEAQGRLDRVT